jgi:hypothetical protein
VERPDELWHLDMTAVWVAEHGWVYLMAAIDCCTREIVAWHLETRCRAHEAIGLVERAVAARGIAPGRLTLGTDNGSAFTARAFKLALSARGITHRRGGYRDPESQAFIESCFGKLKERLVWRTEFETLEQARTELAGLRRALPPPPPLGAQQPDAGPAGRDQGGWTDPPNPRGLERQHQRGAGHHASQDVRPHRPDLRPRLPQRGQAAQHLGREVARPDRPAREAPRASVDSERARPCLAFCANATPRRCSRRSSSRPDAESRARSAPA